MSAGLRQVAALACIALAASGCALQPHLSEQTPLVERPRAASFDLEGRIAASDGDRAASGRLRWEHRPQGDDWVVLSPLGQIVAQVIGTPEGAMLRTADGQRLLAPDTSTLLPHVLGVDAPADHLADWIQAIPAPGARVLETDEVGRPVRISDSGWIIEYLEYADDGPHANPRRLLAQWGQARLRIVVDAWTPLD
ncbi:MAG: lipoprotein insertase outer membrane protein LolB [Zoogloeaceae bacterium]|nr:lipoprotein insertase outer membrane protein LolB [Zoogloeaceae bacterium]